MSHRRARFSLLTDRTAPRSGWLRAALAAIMAAALIVPLMPAQSAAAADPLVFALIGISKQATPSPDVRAAVAGETVVFDIDVSCSSTQTDCVNMKLTDAMPAPLQLVAVSTSTFYTTVITGNTFVSTFTVPLDEGGFGLQSGELVPIQVTAVVPSNADSSFDGQTIVNTAYVTVDNPDSNVQDAAPVLLSVPRTLASTITKTVTPSSTVGLPDVAVNFDVSAKNTTNGVVDQLIIQDPAEPASNAFDYLEVTGLTNVVFPTGANRVRVDWFDGTTWNTGTPAATAVLPVAPALVKGVRLTFTNSASTPIAAGSTGSFRLATKTTSAVSTMVGDFMGSNLASSQVISGAASNTPVLAEARFTIRQSGVKPAATKVFQPDVIIGGRPIVVRLGGSNDGDFTLSRMTITEPKTGTTSLADQGITFSAWTSDLEWPTGATAASVRYLYEGTGLGAPLTTTTVDTLPAPGPGVVRGFTVSFTGAMAAGAYSVLPYNATTDTVSTAVADLTTTNTIAVDVETTGGQTATVDAADELTRRTSRVNTTVRKLISPNEIYGVAGSTALLSLPSAVSPAPASTVGAKTFTVSDADPEFWSRFNATSIVATDVPASSVMTAQYLVGSTWTDLPGAVDIAGPQSLTLSIPVGLRDSIEGIRFVFVPSDAAGVLPPGFNVQPNIRVALRSTLRGTSTPVVDPAATAPVRVGNTVTSEVTNPVADPPTATDSAEEGITLLPIPPGGPGVIDKNWKVDEVRARSGDRATLTLSWGTAGVEYDSVTISDTATDPGSSSWNVADTVFEAFDLVSIPAITTAMDPLLRYDAVRSVQLYIPGSGWVNTQTNPCASGACNGAFPGYTLTTSERQNAIGVRLTFAERPNRSAPTSANPDAPAIGSGVATSVRAARELDLTFEVRDTRRSNPAVAVLGSSREATYNVPTQFGVVRNEARMQGFDAAGTLLNTGTAADDILILDRPITVGATKSWIDGPLGVPPLGTDASYFPIAQLILGGKNTSVVRVNELSVTEPTNGTTPFDYVNVFDIVDISVPSGATATTVTLVRGSAGATTYTRAQALALTFAADDLDQVTSITVKHTGRIDSNASTTITIDTQLREFVRGSATRVGPVGPSDPRIINNAVTAAVTDPSGTDPLVAGDTTVTATATDTLAIASMEYGVVGTKKIEADTTANVGSPAIQYDESSRLAKITLTGQQTGNVRTTKMVFEDTTPSFWNAYNFSSFGPGDDGPVTPVQQVQVDALVGVTYSVDPITNAITSTCPTSDCWVTGTPAATLTLPALGSTPLTAIRGLRFTYTKVDQSNWEHPYNPIQSVEFSVERRTTLVAKAPAAANDDVPSTLFDYAAPAPGETERGTYTNAMKVTATGGSTSLIDPVWIRTATDSRQILFQHLPARVEIKKSPVGLQSLGVDIPYQIAVTNRGGANERVLRDVVVTDLIPTGPGPSDGAMLVIPNDPDTGMPFPLDQAFTYRLVNATGVVQPVPTVTATYTSLTPTTPTYRFALVAPAALPKGWTLTINATMQLRPLLEAGTDVLNRATVTSDQIFDSCDSWSNATTQLPRTTFVETCTTDTSVRVLASAPMTIVKGVRGVRAGPLDATGTTPLLDSSNVPFDDLGILKTVPGSSVDCAAPNVSTGVVAEYYRFPCVPITRPGGIEEWASTFTNGGNIDVTRIAAIDVLPRAGDRGVIVNESRSSKWTPTLTTLPTLVGGPSDAVLRVEYLNSAAAASTRCNATDIQNQLGMTATSNPPVTRPSCLTGSAVDDLPMRNWMTLTQAIIDADPTSIIAVRFVISSASGLKPGQKISVIHRSRTAPAPEIAENASGLDRDSIAYNSIAAAALGDDNGTPTANRFVIEPRKVGVAMATGAVELEKLVDGSNAGATYLQNSFRVDLECTSAGQSFEIRNSDGTLRTPFTITGGTAATLIKGLPLYATCAVTEADYNSVQTITPSSVVAQSAHTTTQLVYDPQPKFDSPTGDVYRPEIERSTITNTYNKAGFTVRKSVDYGGAVDAAGVPITYGGFVFSAVCRFNNGVSTSTVLNTTFTLATAADTRSFTNLPAGAVCTITETTTRSPLSTSVVATGGTVTSNTGTAVVMTLGANSAGEVATNDFAFTNEFGVGSLQINKLITGLGAPLYGGGTFTINVSCTRNVSGANANVYTKSFTFDRDDVLTRTIDNLPTGARCTVSEPTSGQAGATVSTVQGAIIIGNGTTVTRSVTNRFDFAQLVITKEVFTDAATSTGQEVILDSPFSISATCSFQGSPVYAAGYSATVPMAFSLEHLESAKLTQLPAGASCTVTEQNPQYEDSTDIVVLRGSPVVATSFVGTRTATFTIVADSSTGVGQNEARVNNNYGVASFTVSKDLRGGGAAQFGTGPFIVHVTCIAPDDTIAYDADIELTPAQLSVTITTVAADSVCSVEETGFGTTLPNATIYRDGDGVLFDGRGINVTDDTPSVTIENWYLTGSVEVAKVVNGPAASTFGDGPFEVTLACELDGITVNVVDPVREILDGEIETYTLLPDGADCTLTESDRGGATSSIIVRSGSFVTENAADGWDFTIDDIDDFSLTDNQPQIGFEVQNTFEFAELAITKNVASDATNQDGDAVEYGSFPVSVDCVFNGDTVYAEGFNTVPPVAMQRDLANAETWTLTNLPRGAICTVTETDTMDSASTSISTVVGSGSAETTAGETARLTLASANTAEITNNYEVGSLLLTKELAGAGGSAWGTERFTVDVSCSLTDSSGTRNVWLKSYGFQVNAAGVMTPASVLIDDLAVGAVCTITETQTGGANSTSITVDTVTTDDVSATATVTAADDPTEVVVTNTFDVSDVNVTKEITGPGATLYGAGPFQVSLSCTREVNGATVDVAIPGGALRDLVSSTLPSYYATYENLPAGAECDLVETLTGGANSSTVVEAVNGAPGSFVLGPIPSEVTVTNFFDDPTVFVRKELSGEGAALYGAGPFEVQLSCTRVVNGATVPVAIPGGDTRVLDSAGNYEAQFDFLPTGASCTLTETKTTGATFAFVTDPTFILGASDVVTLVNLENVFDLAELRLTKKVIGTAASSRLTEEFEVKLTCERNLNGTMTDVEIPGGAERTIRHNEEIVFDDLPANAVCTIAETRGGGANFVALNYNGLPLLTQEFTLGAGVSTMTMSNVFLLAITGVDALPVALGALLLLIIGAVLMFVQRRRRRLQD